MNVYILGFDQSYATTIVSLMDIFYRAEQNVLESRQPSAPAKMSVRLVSIDGKPILCKNNMLLNVYGSIEEIREADIIIITSIHKIDTNWSEYRFLVDWLKERYQRGSALASVCTGAFLLAETGLLDGKDATTHWIASDHFRERYPKIRLKAEKLIVNHGDLYCSGGVGSSVDLAYYLVEKYLGHSLAARTAKFFIHDFRRRSQHAYEIFNKKTDHTDMQILRTQKWINDHLTDSPNMGQLLKVACLSQRTFERRFKKATGDSPLAYLQRLRVETAKQQLETTNLTFDEISYQMGYKNSGSFRKIFVKWVDLLPSEYRERFQAFNQSGDVNK